MGNLEDEKFELPPDSAAVIAGVPEGQRAWVLKSLEETEIPPSLFVTRIDSVRLRVNRLLKTAEFFEKLSQTREIQEIDQLLENDLRRELNDFKGARDLKSFPGYEKIVRDALMFCLNQQHEPKAPRRVCISCALTIRTVLGRDMAFSDAESPGYTDAWKFAFVYAIDDNSGLAMSIAEAIKGEVNLREISNYETLVKNRYYQLMLTFHKQEDKAFRSALGDGIEFVERDQKVIDRMSECLNDISDWHVADVLYILEKFGRDVSFGPDNIEHFEQGVKAAFLWCLQHGNLGVSSAKIIRDQLGAGISFDDEVRSGMVYNLDRFQSHEQHWLERALDIKKSLGEGVDFNVDTECQRAVVAVCMRMLLPAFWKVEYIVSIKRELGVGVIFSENTVSGYAATIKIPAEDPGRKPVGVKA